MSDFDVAVVLFVHLFGFDDFATSLEIKTATWYLWNDRVTYQGGTQDFLVFSERQSVDLRVFSGGPSYNVLDVMCSASCLLLKARSWQYPEYFPFTLPCVNLIKPRSLKPTWYQASWQSKADLT